MKHDSNPKQKNEQITIRVMHMHSNSDLLPNMLSTETLHHLKAETADSNSPKIGNRSTAFNQKHTFF